HYTTTNEWFRTLEAKGIHYVTRAPDGKRVYDELDLRVGKFIKHKREEGWNKEGIFNLLLSDPPFELRPLPDGETPTDVLPIDQIKNLLQSREFTSILENQLVETVKSVLTDFRQKEIEVQAELLENTLHDQRLEQRQKEITARITTHRINTELEIEALEKWSQLPAEERLIKTGLFRKEEDQTKKDLFIKKYVRDNFEQRLRSEMESQ
ncbi:hypothetical protein, partial [Paenibacillus campinasensis]